MAYRLDRRCFRSIQGEILLSTLFSAKVKSADDRYELKRYQVMCFNEEKLA